MKKQLIASLVGALLLFVWQFLSWSILPTHKAEYGYTPNQDRIMEALNQNLTEDGAYFMPGLPPGSTHEQEEAAMKSSIGKPWASVSYHKAMEMNMSMNMFRGFIADLLAVFLLTWLLQKIVNLDMRTAALGSIAVGVISDLTIPYLNSIWFESRSIGHLVDALVSWGLVGVWLGWWLPRP